jgi:hypothetical protein
MPLPTDGRAGSKLTWSFENDVFWLTPATLYARSRMAK